MSKTLRREPDYDQVKVKPTTKRKPQNRAKLLNQYLSGKLEEN